jgi:hypothetical protein
MIINRHMDDWLEHGASRQQEKAARLIVGRALRDWGDNQPSVKVERVK